MIIEHRTAFDVPVRVAWEVLGEGFGEIGAWSTVVAASHLHGELGEGAARVCELPGSGGEIHEAITHFDRGRMELAYRVSEGLPPIMERAANRWTFTEDGPDRCVVTIRAEARLRWWARPLQPLIRRPIARQVARFFAEARAHIEAGAGEAPATRAV